MRPIAFTTANNCTSIYVPGSKTILLQFFLIFFHLQALLSQPQQMPTLVLSIFIILREWGVFGNWSQSYDF
jgi:hypothetical protein